jgi:tellurite methyltransferase
LDNNNSISALLGRTDIYLIDQIMKGRYEPGDKILDAGCGSGRNMHWFVQNNLEIYGIDSSEEAIINLRNEYPTLPAENLQVSHIEKLPFPNHFFDHVISSAVLHFANNTAHFKAMMEEMLRVLKPRGTLFIRMTSDMGMENKVQLLPNGNHLIPDGSMRFLLTRSLLAECILQFTLSFLEPLKTVNVNDMRCMSTLMFEKK